MLSNSQPDQLLNDVNVTMALTFETAVPSMQHLLSD